MCPAKHSPFYFGFHTLFFAGLIFIPLTIGKWQRLTVRQWLEIILVGFFGITVNIAFFFLGVKTTESINVPIIASAAPVFIYLLSLFFLKEKPKIKVMWGMLTALLGVILIIVSPILTAGKSFIAGEIRGNLFILIATLGTVFQTLIGRDILRKVNSYQVSLVTFFFGAITFFPFFLNEMNYWSFAQLNGQGWLGIIFGVIFSSALAYWLFYYGVSKVSAQEVGIFAYIDPVTTILVAVPLLGEYPDMFYFFGSILIFGGIYFAEGRLHWHPWHKLRNNK
ncbi:MAG TPA: DMT family transporter [Patescibacteria group bacterium]